MVGDGRMAHRPRRVGGVAIPPPDSRPHDVTVSDEIVEHAMHLALGELRPFGELADGRVRGSRDFDQRQGM